MPDPKEKQLNETMQSIEKGLGDLKKNMATKQEVIDLIDEKTSEDKDFLASVKENQESVSTSVKELDDATKILQKQIKSLARNNYAALKDGQGHYKGIFGSAQEAKIFGLHILAGADMAKNYGKHDNAVKALADMGIEIKWLDAEGKAMTTGSATGGSAIVTSDVLGNLVSIQERYSVYRRNVSIYPMASARSPVPKLSSGLTVYCPGEGTAVTQSAPLLDLLNIVAKSWLTLTAISLELDADSAIAIGELVGRQIFQAFGKKEDEVGFLGDGTSTSFGHTGITGALLAVDATIGNIKSLTVASGNAYSEITLADFEKVVGNLPDIADDGEAKWYNHRYFYYTVMVKLALAASGANATEVIQGAGERQKSFLAYPLEFAQVMPRAEANSQICSIFGNLRLGAYLGTRGGVEVAQSDQRYFDQALLAIRGMQRVGFNVHGVGDTTDAGPIGALITAAA